MKKNIVIYSLIFLLITSNLVWLQTKKNSHADNQTTSSSSKDYPYLSKRIFAENQNDILINFQPLRKKLESDFANLPPNTEVSFYFEYLPSGTSIRIGDNNELVAASLLKVPLVMNLYKASELGKLNLDEKVTITPDQLDRSYGNLWKRGAGTQITLREAARLTIADSDNTGSRVLFTKLRGVLPESQQSFAQLDIDQNLQDGQAVINAKSYSSVLKSLYFSSYINRDNSQQILNFLTQSSESRRLTAQLPNQIKVAHKNGVHNTKWAESDCGIVYVPNRPYSVCLMVGLPDDQANAFISTISKQIYDYVATYK